MELKKIIERRRAYRSLEPVNITGDLIRDLAGCASLSPSCFNNQPWRYIFIHDPEALIKMRTAMNQGNEWTNAASMIIAVLGKKDMDCLMKDGREYFTYDIGMATALIILRATEMGLVAHPIAGYNPATVKDILGIPEDMNVITLVIVGKHSDRISQVLSEKQVEWEKERPARLPLEKIFCENKYCF